MADLRTLFDAHFQKSFLAFVVRDSDFLEKVVRDLDRNLFDDDYAQHVVGAVLEFHKTNAAAPDKLIYQVIGRYLQSGLLKDETHQLIVALVADLFKIPLQNKVYILSEFDKFLRYSVFETKLPLIVEDVRKADFDKAEEKLREIFTYKPSLSNTLGTFYDDDVGSRNARREQEASHRLWTLIPPLDRLVPGLAKGEIGVWQSQRSSAGKSAALAFLAKSFALQGKNVVIFSLEMSEQSYEDRLDQVVSGLDRKGLKDTERARVRIQGLLKHGGRIVVKCFPMYGTRCSDLRAHCRMLESLKGFRPDAVLIDYADLLAPETKALRDDLYGTGAEVYAYWRGWMHEEGLVGWTGMQSGREAMKERFADQAHAAGSIAKIQIADVVLSINRTPEEEANNNTCIHVVKARQSKARFDINFPSDFDRMQFWDASRDGSWQEGIVV